MRFEGERLGVSLRVPFGLPGKNEDFDGFLNLPAVNGNRHADSKGSIPD